VTPPPAAMDQLLADTTRLAAESLQVPPGKTLLEAMVEAAMVRGLPDAFGGEVIAKRGPFSIPDWDPLPGAIDLRVIDENGATTVCVELKVTKTDETIWDMLKLLAALRVPGVRSAYVVVASKDDPWGSGREAAELFPSEAGSRLRIRSADLFDRYWRSWTHLLLEGRARPLRAPDEFEIRSVACVPLKLYPGWSIRAVGVQPCGNRWLPFQEGWPLGMTPGC